jgi:glycosyltransferase involved in cell wall biosynthesis
VRRYVARNDLGEFVKFRGHVPRETLLSNLSASDIVCFPSLYEACPLLMIEAMAMAKPVVAFDLPFAREMLGQGSPMLLACNDVDFARKLWHLISSENDRTEIGYLLRSKARNFDAMKIASLYSEIYTTVGRR